MRYSPIIQKTIEYIENSLQDELVLGEHRTIRRFFEVSLSSYFSQGGWRDRIRIYSISKDRQCRKHAALYG
ncbi:hypothetical protein ABE148_16700 [Peribacillus simplex]